MVWCVGLKTRQVNGKQQRKNPNKKVIYLKYTMKRMKIQNCQTNDAMSWFFWTKTNCSNFKWVHRIQTIEAGVQLGFSWVSVDFRLIFGWFSTGFWLIFGFFFTKKISAGVRLFFRWFHYFIRPCIGFIFLAACSQFDGADFDRI